MAETEVSDRIAVLVPFVGYLIGVGRRSQWPEALIERLISVAVTIRSLALGHPSSPELHLAFAGVAAALGALLKELPWDLVVQEEADRWRRDQGLLVVAGKARELRRISAWRRIRGD